jgi:NTE family protein
MEYNWRGIAFEGGGVAGLGHIGAIKVLYEKNIIQNLTHISGSSAGAIIATIVACKLPFETIKEIALSIDYKLLEDSFWFLYSHIYRLFNNFGWNSGDQIIKIFGDILEKYLQNRFITFQQIYDKYGTFLIITSTNFISGCTEYYNHISHPDMSIIDSLRESSSIPVFYSPVLKDNSMYVDGGLLDNYPIEKLYDYLPKDQVFGVKLLSECKTCPSLSNKLPAGITEYLYQLIKIVRHQAAKIHINDDDWKRTIKVNIGNISTIDFNLTDEQKHWLINQGEIAALKFLDK